MPNVLELPTNQAEPDSLEAIVFKAMQDLLLKILLKSASDDYELRRKRQAAGIKRAKEEGKRLGRQVSQKRIADIISCRQQGLSISKTAKIVGCSEATVKRIYHKVLKEEYSIPQ